MLGFAISGAIQTLVSNGRMRALLYGLKMAAYIGGIFYLTMATSAIIMDFAFTALHLVPKAIPNVAATLVHFNIDYTFWLSPAFGAVAAYFAYLNWRDPMHMRHDPSVTGNVG